MRKSFLGQKKFLSQNFLWVRIVFGSKKFFGEKKSFLGQKSFKVKKVFGSKKFLGQKSGHHGHLGDAQIDPTFFKLGLPLQSHYNGLAVPLTMFFPHSFIFDVPREPSCFCKVCK